MTAMRAIDRKDLDKIVKRLSYEKKEVEEATPIAPRFPCVLNRITIGNLSGRAKTHPPFS
jgi:hypothetical protein